MSAAPELIYVATKKKSSKQSLKNTASKIARKQLGDDRRHRRTSMSVLGKRMSVSTRKKTTIQRKTGSARGRADFFSNIKNGRYFVTQ